MGAKKEPSLTEGEHTHKRTMVIVRYKEFGEKGVDV